VTGPHRQALAPIGADLLRLREPRREDGLTNRCELSELGFHLLDPLHVQMNSSA